MQLVLPSELVGRMGVSVGRGVEVAAVSLPAPQALRMSADSQEKNDGSLTHRLSPELRMEELYTLTGNVPKV